MKKIKIGVLIPYSGIFRNLRSDFCNAMELALPDSIKKDVVFIPEFVQTGGMKQVKDIFNKFSLFESVDLITGVLGNSVIHTLISDFEQEKIPAVISNLGGYIPSATLKSPYLFYNSLQLWKSEWAIGNWAQLKYGGNPMMGTAIYDGGYHLQECFRLGTVNGGAHTCNIYTLKGYDTISDTKPLIEILKEEKPGHAHALLSGAEGKQFLNLFCTDIELLEKQPITVNPFMVEDGMTNVDLAGAEIYNAMAWSHGLELPENIKFVNNYIHNYGEQPNAFALLGFETGQVLGAAIGQLEGKIPNRVNLTESLSKIEIDGPRGLINLSPEKNNDQPIYLRTAKINKQTGLLINEITDQLPTIEYTDESLTAVKVTASGWQNPYLCV
jgi:branched-chain amino acid transport system substrate-binding protein